MNRKHFYTGVFLTMAIAVSSCSKDKATTDPGSTGNDTTSTGNTSAYLAKAQQTAGFIETNLLTVYNSYRVNTTTSANAAYEWYNASQIYADAAMIANGDTTYTGKMKKTYSWLQNLWDRADANGGYFAFANLDGTGSSGTKYVDDNSLTGVAYLDAYDNTSGADKAAYLNSAESCAGWLMNSGLWDNTFGGGFWWSTDKTYKPTQSNGLALQLFLRLYQITGEQQYHDWAININNWLNSKMYDSNKGLYIWQIEANGTVDNQNFTYDNAIMLEADLMYRESMKDDSYLAKAQALGNAMITTLWNAAHNVFIFNTTDIRMNPTYCGWASQAMIRLYEADNNPAWLGYAKGNIDAINLVLRDGASYGYYQYAGLDGTGRYTNMEGVDQAWMQRVQIMLSKYK